MSNKIKLFKKKPMLEKSVGEFTFKWYYNEKDPKGCYLEIGTTSGIWGMKISGGTYTYGYLLAAAKQDLDSQLSGFATYNFIIASEITQDEGLTNDLTRIINKWWKRKEKSAEEAAKSVTPEQEEADTAFMNSVVEYAEADPKRRKEMQAEDKAILKQILSEKGEGE